ncbi:MAG: hypothetical protein WCX65_14785, partial [bacterium]
GLSNVRHIFRILTDGKNKINQYALNPDILKKEMSQNDRIGVRNISLRFLTQNNCRSAASLQNVA